MEQSEHTASARPAANAVARHPRWVLAATILGSGMAFLDGTVVNVALPRLQHDLGATVAGAQWIVEGYAILLAALLLVGGVLGDRYGRRRVFTIGVAGFALASIGCGLAPSLSALVAARALQGVAGALLVPGSLALLSATFPKDERGRAIGVWSGFSAINAGLGLVLGGVLLDAASWRWLFFLNVPVAAAALAIAARFVPESKRGGAGRLDAVGAGLVTLGLFAVTFGLIEASARGWTSRVVLGALGAAALALGAFVARERRCADPMLPLELFRDGTFAGANLLTLLLYAALSGAMFFLPMNLIHVQGYSATAAGAASLPFIVLMFTLSRVSGGLYDRLGPRLPLIVGPLVVAVGLALHARPGVGGGYWTTFFPALSVLGLGMAIVVAPLSTAVMAAVDEGRAGLASGVNNAVSRVAAVLAIAALGPVAVVSFTAAMSPRLDALHLSPAEREAVLAQRLDLGAARPPDGLGEEERAHVERALDEAFVAGYRRVMLATAGLAVLSALVAAVLIRDPRPADETRSAGAG